MSSEETERLVAEIPPELKELVDADQRTNKEVVEAALWREMGGERMASLERRVEEKKNRINMIEREKNERERELQEEKTELDALMTKMESDQQENKEQIEAIAKGLEVVDLSSHPGLTIGQGQEFLESEAERAECTPERLKEVAFAMYRGEYNE